MSFINCLSSGNVVYSQQSILTEDGVRILNMGDAETNGSATYQIDADVNTLADVFVRATRLFGDCPYLGTRANSDSPYIWSTYSSAASVVTNVGSGLIQLGLKPAVDMVGIIARNRPEWTITDLACSANSFVSVPLYETFGPEAIMFILNQTEIKCCVCEDADKAMRLMISPTHIRHIVMMDSAGVSDQVRQRADELSVRVITFDELVDLGKRNPCAAVAPQPEDLATICYTSGTTGMPKGVMLTHFNMISQLESDVFAMRILLEDRTEVHLSYLPLAHMFERLIQLVILVVGGRIGFFQGDVRKLAEDIRELKPTVLCVVPRTLNRFYTEIQNGLLKIPAEAKIQFENAFAAKEKEMREAKPGTLARELSNSPAFQTIRKLFGGSVKLTMTGAAPILPSILHFFRVVMGCEILEGYGATEICGGSSVTLAGDFDLCQVGPPMLRCRYRLLDVPDMNLVVERDNRGEILVQGPSVFKGYFKDDVKTRLVLDEQGWYHTGDIGSFDEKGRLKIMDRVKHIFKLQQGEYIAPEKIENIYQSVPYVAQIFVYGNSFKSSLVAIVVPDEAGAKHWASTQPDGLAATDLATLCTNSLFKQAVLDALISKGKEMKLLGFEQVKDIYLNSEPFSVENNMLTSTLKSKRFEIQKHYQAVIEKMYEHTD